MRTTRLLCAVSALLWISSFASAQVLQAVKTTPIPGEPGAAVAGPFRCDEKGNIYFHRFDGNDNSPVRSITEDGTPRASYFVDPAVTKLPKVQTDEFAVSPDGAVYVFGWNEQDPYLFSFDKDGQYKAKIALDKNTVVHQLGVFPKGEFLLAGLEVGTQENPKGNKPVTQIVDSDGKFLRHVRFGDFRSPAESGDAAFSREGSGIGNLAVSRGIAITGADGNVYLMRHASPAFVYVIPASGEVQSTISVTGPEGSLPMAMQLHGRTLVVQFWNETTKTAVYKVVSVPNGEEVGTYEGGLGIGTGFVCYNGTQFTFLTPKAGKTYLVQAEPK